MLRRPADPAQQLHSACQRYARLAAVAARPQGPAPRCGATAQPRSSLSAAVGHAGSNDPLTRLEAVLFLSHEPLSSRKLSQYANLADGTEARTLVRRLNERYDAAGRSFRAEQVAGGYQLLTRRKFAPWLRRLAHVPEETRLSAPALETLAAIAYRQPIPRAEIEAIRGVNCGEILRQLMERDLVRIEGRSEELGRPYLYATTKRFLQLFGLARLADLPRCVEMRTSPLPIVIVES
jgi:segregation and condensation protein B